MTDYSWTSPEAGRSWDNAYTLAFNAGIVESLGVAEVGSRNVSKPFTESFTVSEKLTRGFVVNVLRSLGVASGYYDNIDFIIRAMEGLGFGETLGKGFTLKQAETLNAVNSGMSKIISLQVHEAVAAMEAFGRTVAYSRSLAEGIHASDALSKAIGLSKCEALDVVEAYIRHANAVVSDMMLLDSAVTYEQFQLMLTSGTSPGYQPFRDFITGDHEYSKALFRAVLESTNSDRTRLSMFRVDVDVPDVTETGTGVITNAAAGLRVNFTRTFHIIPEIITNLRGGTEVAIPDVIDADLTGFTLILRNMSNVRVAGTVTWAAHGY